MINKKHFITLLFIAVLLITYLFGGCSTKDNLESVSSIDNFEVDSLTLLERMYIDTDSDGHNESIELYTDAQLAPDGMMGWDTGHQWVLLVRKGKQIYPLFDDWVQHGELQFWVVSLNNENVVGPESTDLERRIYAMVLGNSFELFNYYWDKKSLSYKKEVILYPHNQWDVRNSNKYSIPDPYRIEQKH